MRIGFIGVGSIGAPMAQRLLAAGHDLAVHDIERRAADPLVGAGARWAASPAELASDREALLSSLPGPAEVRDVALGAEGIIEGAAPGTLYIDLSTNSPTCIRQIAAALGAQGVAVADAPVSGGVSGARAGTLQLMVGCADDVFPEVAAVLAALGTPSHMGGVGTGAIAKLLHNMVSITSTELLAEAFTVGVKAGISPEALRTAILGGGYGRGMLLNHIVPNVIYPRDYAASGFSFPLVRKDIGLAVELAREVGVAVPLASLAEQFLDQAAALGLQDAGSVAAWVAQERLSGVEVLAPEPSPEDP